MNDIEVDLASPEFKADPYPFFARLRETAPVCRVTLPGRQTAWLITRYDDVAAALKDARSLNALVEVAWARAESVTGADRTQASRSFFVSPGIRRA
jgi:cytochrome P450